MGTTKNDIYSIVTSKVIELLEQGVAPWQKAWKNGNGFVSHVDGKAYSFLNSMLITSQGGVEGEYITADQAKKEGGYVKKGAKSKLIVFNKRCYAEEKVTDPETGDETINKKPYFVLRYFLVFHINDCEGINPKYTASTVKCNPIEDAENVIAGYKERESTIKIICDQEDDRPRYSPSTDTIIVPRIQQYDDVNEYYSTLFHEMTHSTGLNKRCNRGLGIKNVAFGSEVYSYEELVAELGSAMCIARLGLDAEKAFKNSASYIAGWLKALKNDTHMIVTASAAAEKAVKYIFDGKTKE